MKKTLLFIIVGILSVLNAGAASPKDIAYADLAERIAGSSTPVVVDCYATWCGPCRAFAPIFDQVADEFGSTAQFFRVDIDDSPEMLKLGVTAVPTVLVFYVKEGQLHVETQEGAVDKTEFQAFLLRALKLADGTPLKR